MSTLDSMEEAKAAQCEEWEKEKQAKQSEATIRQPDGRPEEKKTVDAPEFCVFRKGDVFPMRGFNYEFIGYTKDFHLVFKGNGPTAKTLKKMRTR